MFGKYFNIDLQFPRKTIKWWRSSFGCFQNYRLFYLISSFLWAIIIVELVNCKKAAKKCTELNLKTPLLSFEQIKLINQLTRISRDQEGMIEESILVYEQISQFLEEEGICLKFQV